MSGEPGATSGPPGPEAEDGALDPTASKTWQTLRGLAARDLELTLSPREDVTRSVRLRMKVAELQCAGRPR